MCNIIPFPLQQWLHERVSMLRYTYIACFVPGFYHPITESDRTNSELSVYRPCVMYESIIWTDGCEQRGTVA